MRKNIRNVSIFLLLVFLTFHFIFKGQNFSEILDLIGKVEIRFIILAVLFMSMFVICDGINIRRMLRKLNEKTTIWKCMKYSLIGFFFSAITPAASGGQPMQIYYMHKENIKVANSTLTFLINLSCMQVVTISLALFNMIFNYKYMKLPMVILFVVGIFLNLSALIFLLVSIFSRRVTKGLTNFFVKVMKFFRIKNIEEKKERIENGLEKYQKNAKDIRNNKLVIFKSLITTYIQYISFFSVTYFVYRALGFSEYNMLNLVAIQSVLYGTVSGIPLPGSVGASESAYLALFEHIYKDKNMLETAMVVDRFINFYLLVIISLLIVVINDIYVKIKYKKNKETIKNVDIGNIEDSGNIDNIEKIEEINQVEDFKENEESEGEF